MHINNLTCITLWSCFIIYINMNELFIIKKKKEKKKKKKKKREWTWHVNRDLEYTASIFSQHCHEYLGFKFWSQLNIIKQLGVSTFPCKVSSTGQCRFWESTWNMVGGATSNKSTREIIMDFDDIHCAYGSFCVLWVL